MERRLATYALLEEAKECTFKPRLTSRRSSEEKEEDEEEDGGRKRDAFVDRQEANERARRKELDVRRKKQDYEARLDRKSCPVRDCAQPEQPWISLSRLIVSQGCGVYQSYDEFVEKRLKVTRIAKAWSQEPLTLTRSPAVPELSPGVQAED
jgi:hypothetical protein